MTHSSKKTPIQGNCNCDSEKWSKRLDNRKLRAKVKRELLRCDPFITTALPRELRCWGDKDGRHWFGPITPENLEWLRK